MRSVSGRDGLCSARESAPHCVETASGSPSRCIVFFIADCVSALEPPYVIASAAVMLAGDIAAFPAGAAFDHRSNANVLLPFASAGASAGIAVLSLGAFGSDALGCVEPGRSAAGLW